MGRSSEGAAVLYARCAYCGYTAPLNCSGQFMPHPTMFVEATAMGPTCPMCGPLPPVFTCPFFHTQYLYLAGASPMPQQGYAYAAVVQARGRLGEHAQQGLRRVFRPCRD